VKPYYADDLVTLYHGDARAITPGVIGHVGCVLTDPPYGIAWKQHGGGKTGKSKGMRSLPSIANDHDVSVRDDVLAMLGALPALVFGSFRAPFPKDVFQVLIYQKTPDSGLVGSTTGFRRDVEPIFLLGKWPKANATRSSVVASRIGLQVLAKPGLHPHIKPQDVLAALLRALPAGVVYDPFAGSGSTLVAAKAQGRPSVGVELERRHCRTAADRLSQDVLNLGGVA
jgi:tRNA G10  N-methylase Trm11